jgi:hypothetical protein
LVARNSFSVRSALKNDSFSTGNSGTPLAMDGWKDRGSRMGNTSSKRDKYVVMEDATDLPAGNLYLANSLNPRTSGGSCSLTSER